MVPLKDIRDLPN